MNLTKDKKFLTKNQKLENQAVELLIDNDFPMDQIEVFSMLPLSGNQLLDIAKKLILIPPSNEPKFRPIEEMKKKDKEFLTKP